MSLLNDIYKESPTKVKSRLKIIDSAFDIFSEEGIDYVSFQSIAEKSGITLRNLYRYYDCKESLIIDVAYHYITVLNSTNKITNDESLTGFEQLKDVLEKQIEKDMLSEKNNKVITFVSYFDLYMTNVNTEHKAIKKYINVYAPYIRNNLLEGIKEALTKGVKDDTLNLDAKDIDYYLGYIFHSLMSLSSRVKLKRHEKEIRDYNFIQLHIDIILVKLKK